MERLPPDVLRSMSALAAHRRYQDEMSSTPVGARSEALRIRAQRLSLAGRLDEAHALFSEAVALFAFDDQGAAAAACWYDLAESYTKLRTGVRQEHLLLACDLFQRALQSPTRQRDPLRLALTHDALGRTLRALAEIDHHRGDPRLDEAMEHMKRACGITEALGPVGLVDAAGYRHNLGNLHNQCKRWHEAERCYRRALVHLAAAHADPAQMALTSRPPSRPLKPMLILSLARSLVARGRRGDIVPVRRRLAEVIRDGDPEMVAEAHLLAATALLRHEPASADEAREHLRSVSLWDLRPEHRARFLETLHDAGLTEIARRALPLAVKKSMQHRSTTIADHASDHVAREAQEFSRLLAKLHVDEGRPVEAFLALEETAALRYFEVVQTYTWRPRDAVSYALARRRETTAATAKVLDDLASRIAHATDADARGTIDDLLHGFEDVLAGHTSRVEDSSPPGEHEEVAAVLGRVVEALREARRAPSPSSMLYDAARSVSDESLRAGEALARRDPESNHSDREGAFALSPDGLRRVLEDDPADVLLRVLLHDELLAVAVWLEHGVVMGRALRRPLGREAIRALEALYASAAGAGKPERSASLSANLAVLLPVLGMGDVLPDRRITHLVILPSMLAALIPWAAAGAPGHTLLEHADAISYLPNLTPKLTRQRVAYERRGVVLVAPGDGLQEQPTRFHGLAFSAMSGDETTLFGAEATRENLTREATRADVVSLYTHGTHVAGQGAALSLVGGDLSLDDFDSSWVGCERVELWACQSGVNLPTDWLTPLVDEAFGHDVAFHRAGVRSTIGSLWSVPDLVTAHLVRRYREGLADGYSPPRALADAQRWWRDTVVATLPELLASTPERRVSDAIAQLLGTSIAPDEIGATLGPLHADAPLPRQEQEHLVREFSSPEAWAGFRFLGVVDRRPEVVPGESVRPLSPEELAEFDALLAAKPAPGRDVDEVHRERLAEATALGHHEFPTPSQAVMAARCYAERGLGSLRHNLLRGLAWVHEALAAPLVVDDDRRALAVEATWLWTELARGELDIEQLRPIYPTDPVVVARARVLLEGCASAPEAPILRAWIERLEAQDPALNDDPTARWPSLRAAVEACTDRYRALRAAALAVEWLLTFGDFPYAVTVDAVGLARAVLSPGGTSDTFFLAQRLRSGLSVIALRVGETLEPPPPHLLSAREVARTTVWFARAERTNPELGIDGRDVASTMLDRLEGVHWGAPGDDLTDFWDSSGTPGIAWQRVFSGYLSMRFRAVSEPRLALHHIASLQMGADLRVGAANLQAHRLPPRPDGEVPATAAWCREHLLQRLEDLARLRDFERLGKEMCSASVDAFRASADDLLRSGAQSPWALTSWDAATTVCDGQVALPAARTCAFLMERQLLATDAAMHQNWRTLREGFAAALPSDAPEGAATNALQALAPPRRLTDIEAWLRDVPASRVVLGVSTSHAGELLLSAVGKAGEELFAETVRSPDALAWELLAVTQALIAPSPIDPTPLRGTEPKRAEALGRLCALLDEVLGRCFARLPNDRPRMLSVFAPGPLRAVPWWALTAHGVALRERFAAVTLLPCLGFGGDAPVGDGSRVFCALGDEREEGETCFGACAVKSLRAWFPNTAAAEPVDGSRGTDIVEVDCLGEVSTRVEVVRWYGVGSSITVNPSTEGLRLAGHRTLSSRNLFGTTLPRCRRVEYWAATGDLGSLLSTITGDRDVFPSLVWNALASGAAGVLDLAWPVHDLVKALVCERFGVITGRHPEVPGAAALGVAMREVSALLARWRREAATFETTRGALGWLDEARRVYAREAGLDPASVVAFVAHADAPCVVSDPDELTRRCASPVQLGAFRWWGI